MQNQQNGDTTFPAELTAEMLADFRTTPRGCTHPRVGEIGGHRFIAKCGSWSAYSSDEHVHNEFVADNLLRAAGLNVPFSREYRVDFEDGRGRQTIRLAVYDDALKPIMEVWDSADAMLRAKIRAQAVAAYPVQALIAGIDTFTWDNVKVDAEGNLVLWTTGRASISAPAGSSRAGSGNGTTWPIRGVATSPSPSIPISTIFAASSARSMMQNSGLRRRIAGFLNLWLNCPTRIARRS